MTSAESGSFDNINVPGVNKEMSSEHSFSSKGLVYEAPQIPKVGTTTTSEPVGKIISITSLERDNNRSMTAPVGALSDSASSSGSTDPLPHRPIPSRLCGQSVMMRSGDHTIADKIEEEHMKTVSHTNSKGGVTLAGSNRGVGKKLSVAQNGLGMLARGTKKFTMMFDATAHQTSQEKGAIGANGKRDSLGAAILVNLTGMRESIAGVARRTKRSVRKLQSTNSLFSRVSRVSRGGNISGSGSGSGAGSRSIAALKKGLKGIRSKSQKTMNKLMTGGSSEHGTSTNPTGKVREIRDGLQGTYELPEEFRMHGGFWGRICPEFIPQLEEAYEASLANHLRFSSRLELYAVYTMYMLSLIARIILDSSLGELVFEPDNAHALVVIILLSTWLMIFKMFFNPILRAKMLRWISTLLVTYVIVWQCVSPMEGEVNGLSRIIKMQLILVCWASLPALVPLKTLLFYTHAAPILWGTMFTLTHPDNNPAYVLHHCFYFYACNLLLFMGSRRRSMEIRLEYLKDRMNQQLETHDQVKIKRLATQMEKMKEIMESDMDVSSQKNKLNELKANLENPEIKKNIQRKHQALIEAYIALSKGQSPDSEIARLEKLSSDFEDLKSFSEAESRRLANIMEDLYANFAQLPEWRSVTTCPAFEMYERLPEYPKEKICQTSACGWWRWDHVPPIADRVGLEMDHLNWYSYRALWARSTFQTILKDAVQMFNQASCPEDLGLDALDVMDTWNRKHPDKKIEHLPFTPDEPLNVEGLTMSSAMASDYVEHGQHAGLQIGPNKLLQRVRAKVEEYETEEPDKYPSQDNLAKYVCDWLRGRVIFANPLAMSVFFWYLQFRVPKFKVLLCKNKLLKPPKGDTSCNIHLNVRFKVQGEEHTAEIQLLLENFLIAKDLEHKYYEFRRATRLSELLAPVLEVLEAEDDDDEAEYDDEDEDDIKQKRKTELKMKMALEEDDEDEEVDDLGYGPSGSVCSHQDSSRSLDSNGSAPPRIAENGPKKRSILKNGGSADKKKKSVLKNGINRASISAAGHQTQEFEAGSSAGSMSVENSSNLQAQTPAAQNDDTEISLPLSSAVVHAALMRITEGDRETINLSQSIDIRDTTETIV